MRVDPRLVLVSLLFTRSAQAVTAPLTAEGPDGSTVREVGVLSSPGGPGLAAAQALGLAEGFRTVAANPGDWRSFAIVHDSTITWPSRVTLWRECEGREVAALQVFVMSPPIEQRVTMLGTMFPARLDPGTLWRKRVRSGAVATVVFARFPVDSCRGEATGLRVGRARVLEAATGR